MFPRKAYPGLVARFLARCVGVTRAAFTATVFTGLVFTSMALTATACGPKEPTVVKAKVKAGEMPAEGNWRGVYYDQTYGFLHLLTSGDTVTGKWRTAAGEKWGELVGKVDGDILRYEWKEHRIGMFGPNATSHGKGYFRYVIPKDDNADHELHGEWGLNENEAGNPWNAVKQRNMQPDPDSVMPDENQTTVSGGDWDGSGSSSDKASGYKKKKKKDNDDWE
jgi:hypothetical protein